MKENETKNKIYKILLAFFVLIITTSLLLFFFPPQCAASLCFGYSLVINLIICVVFSYYALSVLVPRGRLELLRSVAIPILAFLISPIVSGIISTPNRLIIGSLASIKYPTVSISILSPEPNAIVKIGKPFKIEWESKNMPDGLLYGPKISYFDSDGIGDIISFQAPVSGSLEFTLPRETVTRYRLKTGTYYIVLEWYAKKDEDSVFQPSSSQHARSQVSINVTD